MEIGASSLSFLSRKIANQLPLADNVSYQDPDSTATHSMDTSHPWKSDDPALLNDENSGNELPQKKKKRPSAGGITPGRALATFLTGGLSTLAMQPLVQSMMGRRMTPPPLSKLLTYALMGGGVASGVDMLREKLKHTIDRTDPNEGEPMQGGGNMMGVKMGWALAGFDKEAASYMGTNAGVMPWQKAAPAGSPQPGGAPGMAPTPTPAGPGLLSRALSGAGQGAVNFGSGFSRGVGTPWGKSIGPRTKQRQTLAGGAGVRAGQALRGVGAGTGAVGKWLANVAKKRSVPGGAGVGGGAGGGGRAGGGGGILSGAGIGGGIGALLGGALGSVPGVVIGGGLGSLIGGGLQKGLPALAKSYRSGQNIGGAPSSTAGKTVSPLDKGQQGLDMNTMMAMSLLGGGGGGGGISFGGGGGNPMMNLLNMHIMNKMIGQMGGMQNLMGNIVPQQGKLNISAGGAKPQTAAPQFTVPTGPGAATTSAAGKSPITVSPGVTSPAVTMSRPLANVSLPVSKKVP